VTRVTRQVTRLGHSPGLASHSSDRASDGDSASDSSDLTWRVTWRVVMPRASAMGVSE
jgi:hypothetical protein